MIVIGKDLATALQLKAIYSEPWDGILSVKSSDPSRLLIGRGSAAPSESVLLSDADSDSINYAYLSLHALADNGDVDVILQGRAPGVGIGERHLRVALRPSGLFWETDANIGVELGGTQSISVKAAPILADGRPGPSQSPRTGITSPITAISSDPQALRVNQAFNQGLSTEIRLQGVRAGTYTLVPSSPLIPPARYWLSSARRA